MRKRMAIVLVASLCTAQSALSQSARDERWQFELTPYLFAAGMKGTSGVRGVSADIDMSFSDILENLDGGFMGIFEARKGAWILALDAVYMKLSDEPSRSWSGPLGNSNTASLSASAKQFLMQPYVGRRVFDQRAKVDLVGGARYTRLDVEARLDVATGSPLLPDGSRSATRREEWWDPVVGIRVTYPLAERWSVIGYFDHGIGGSHNTYQAIAGVNWRFRDNLTAKFGYRYLYQDHTKDDFVWDMKSYGLYAGLGIAF
jgi:opacity protein-like surface antigen